MERGKIIVVLAMTLLALFQWRSAAAMLIPSDAGMSGQETSQRTQDLQAIQQVLELKVLRQRLVDLGFSPDEITAKLGGLSDEQIHTFAQQIESVMVGGFHGADDLLHGGLSLLVLVVIIVLVILLI